MNTFTYNSSGSDNDNKKHSNINEHDRKGNIAITNEEQILIG